MGHPSGYGPSKCRAWSLLQRSYTKQAAKINQGLYVFNTLCMYVACLAQQKLYLYMQCMFLHLFRNDMPLYSIRPDFTLMLHFVDSRKNLPLIYTDKLKGKFQALCS